MIRAANINKLIVPGMLILLVGLVACKSATTTTTTTSSVPIISATTTSTSTITTTAQSVSIDLVAQSFSFSPSTITVPAGSNVTIHFANKDSAPHNFAAYETSAVQKSIFVGKIITGPTATIDYTFTAPTAPGNYFFRCDVHPNMNGSFIVTAP